MNEYDMSTLYMLVRDIVVVVGGIGTVMLCGSGVLTIDETIMFLLLYILLTLGPLGDPA